MWIVCADSDVKLRIEPIKTTSLIGRICANAGVRCSFDCFLFRTAETDEGIRLSNTLTSIKHLLTITK